MIDTIDGKYEIFRVALDYEALHEAFVDRVEDLNVPRLAIDVAGKLAAGHASCLLSTPPTKLFGKESLGKMLKATGMALVLVIDDERFAPIKAKMAKRRRIDKPAIAGSKRPAWLFRKDKAREMGKRRFALMTESQLKRHQRKAGKASGKVRRSRLKQQQAISLKSRKALSPAI